MEDEDTSVSETTENAATESLVAEANFWDYLYQLQKTGVLCDLQMCVKDKDDFIAFPVHKIILSGSSRFFGSCLQNDTLCDYYHFDGITSEQLQLVIDYVYRQIRWDELIGHPLGQVLIDTLQVINHDKHEWNEQNNQDFSANSITDRNGKKKKKISTSRRVLLCADDLKNAIDDARSLIPKKMPGRQVNKNQDYNGRINNINLQQSGNITNTVVKEYHDGKIYIIKEETKTVNSIDPKTTPDQAVQSEYNNENNVDNCGTKLTVPVTHENEKLDDGFGDDRSIVSMASNGIKKKGTSEKESCKDSIAQDMGKVSVTVLDGVLECNTQITQSQLVDDFETKSESVDRFSSTKPMAKYFSCFQSLNKNEHKGTSSMKTRLVLCKQKTTELQKEPENIETPLIKCERKPRNPSEFESKIHIENETNIQIDSPFAISKNTSIKGENMDNSNLSPVCDDTSYDGPDCGKNETVEHQNAQGDERCAADVSMEDGNSVDVQGNCDTVKEQTQVDSDPSEENCDVAKSNEDDYDCDQGLHLECEDVQKQFQGDEATKMLDERMKNSHSEQSLSTYTCSKCSYQSSNMANIRSHERKIHKLDVSYTCEYCNGQYQVKKQFYRHLVKEHNCQPYDCHVCGAKFTSYEGMKHHLDTNHKINNRPHMCEICGKDFKLKQQLKNHLNITHKEAADIPCQLCDRMFKQFSTLSRHLKTFHSDVRNFPCHICHKAFKTSDDRNKHMRRHFCPNKRMDEHGNKVPKHPPGLDYKCSFCGKIFKNVNQMRAHERKIHIEKQEGVSYLCTICSKMFETRHYLNMHISNTHRAKTIECPDCLHLFNFKYELRRHKVKCKGYPTGPKPFKCDTCQKAFTMKGNLTKHQQLGRCKVEKNKQPIIPVDGDFVVMVQEGDPVRKVDIPFDQIQQLDSSQLQSGDQNISHLIQPAELVVYSRQLENIDNSQVNEHQQTVIYNTDSGVTVPVNTTNTASSEITDVINTEIINSLTQTVVDGSGFSVVGGVESNVIVADNELIIYEGH